MISPTFRLRRSSICFLSINFFEWLFTKPFPESGEHRPIHDYPRLAQFFANHLFSSHSPLISSTGLVREPCRRLHRQLLARLFPKELPLCSYLRPLR